MAVTVLVGGTNISTYGLRLLKFNGHDMNFPAYKEILENNDLSDEMRKHVENTADLVLVGKYTSWGNMNTALNQFKNKIKSAIKLQWIISTHGFSEYCVVKEGMRIEYFKGFYLRISFTLSITSAS